jgi:hypothetical protein
MILTPQTEVSILNYLSYSFLAQLVEEKQLQEDVKNAISYLLELKFIKQKEKVNSQDSSLPTITLLQPTPLGSAAHHSSFSPEEAIIVHGEIERAMRKGIILFDDLHLVYLLTPIFNIPQVNDWQNYFRIYTSLPEEKQEIGVRVGLTWSYLQNRNVGGNGR